MDAKRTRVAVGHESDSASADARMSIDLVVPAAGRGKLAIFAHGRNGSSDSPHAMKVVGAYLECGYLVLAPDLCNSTGNDSAGTGAEFTVGTHVRDVRRTIEWALREAGALGWSEDSFALAGHSMGGYAVCRLAAEEWARSAHILAVSPFTTGRRQFEARAKLADGIATLKREAPLALEDWAAHDVFRFVDRLTMPVSAVAGRHDVITSPADVRELFDRLPRGVEFCLLPDAHHCLEGDGVEPILVRQIRLLEAAAASAA